MKDKELKAYTKKQLGLMLDIAHQKKAELKKDLADAKMATDVVAHNLDQVRAQVEKLQNNLMLSKEEARDLQSRLTGAEVCVQDLERQSRDWLDQLNAARHDLNETRSELKVLKAAKDKAQNKLLRQLGMAKVTIRTMAVEWTEDVQDLIEKAAKSDTEG